jgi:hypothetical protein
VGGARALTIFRRRQRSFESEAPSTTLLRRVVPLPHLRGGGCVRPFSRRDRRASCVLTMSNSPASRRSPDERSDIRVRSTNFYAAPGFRFAHPGYETFFSAHFRQRKKGNGTPADAHCNARPHTACGARHGEGGLRRPSASGALACRRATTALAAATERHRSAPVHALPGTERVRDGRYPPPAVPVQRAM